MFSYIVPCLHSWKEAYLIKVENVFCMSLDSVCKYFMEYFYLNVHNGHCSEYLFHDEYLCALCISLTVASEIEFGNTSSIFIHWKSLKIVGISTFLKLWKSSALKLFEFLLFVLGSILMTVSISLGVIRLLYHFSDLDWVWIIDVCLESHLDYPFFWSIGFWN